MLLLSRNWEHCI